MSDPMDEFNESIDVSTREEVREISGDFWCNAYGNYFAPYESDEIWCTYGSALCPRYEDYLAEAEAADTTAVFSQYVEVVLSGFVGDPIDESFEPECYRTFYVTSLHDMWVVKLPKVPGGRLVPPMRKDME